MACRGPSLMLYLLMSPNSIVFLVNRMELLTHEDQVSGDGEWGATWMTNAQVYKRPSAPTVSLCCAEGRSSV